MKYDKYMDDNIYTSDDEDMDETTSNIEIKGGLLGLIRTTQRNYINLTNIADNKAQILISINSLMLTILIPIILANYEIIVDKKFYLPLAVFATTCLLTILFSAMVLTPFNGNKQKNEVKKNNAKRSPFFFTGYADLTLDEYKTLFKETVATKERTNQIIVSDLYYFGVNLSAKYLLVKRSYQVFNTGMLVSFIVFLLTVLLQ